MTDSTFRRIEVDRNKGFGPMAILLCGFAAQEEKALNDLCRMVDIEGAKMIYCTEAMLQQSLGDALNSPAPGLPLAPERLPRVVILSGLSGAQLHGFLNNFNSVKLTRPIFAAATPANMNYTLRQLIIELLAEHRYMQSQKK